MLYETIITILKETTTPYEEFEHEASVTCEESAAVRGGIDGVGSKNILMKASKTGRYFLCVTLANAKIGKQELRPVMGEKEFRFVTEEEMHGLYPGAERGAVPPIGHPFDFLTLIDEAIFTHDFFLFNPGVHTKTIRVKTSNLRSIYTKKYSNVLFFSSESQKTTKVLQLSSQGTSVHNERRNISSGGLRP